MLLAQQTVPATHPREDFIWLVPGGLWTADEDTGSVCTDSTRHVRQGNKSAVSRYGLRLYSCLLCLHLVSKSSNEN